MINIINTLFAIPLGYSVGASALVGRCIGRGNIPKAKIYMKQCVYMALLTSFLPCLFFLVMPRAVIGIFTTDEDVIDCAVMALMISTIGF